MKKTATFLFVILLCSFTFGITFWVSWEGEDFYRAAASRFSEKTGIPVEIVYFPKIEEKLNVSLKTGDLPDAVMIKDTYVGDVAASKRNLPIPESVLRDYPERYLSAFTWNGEVSAVPYYADSQVAFINLDAFEEAGLNLEDDFDFVQFEIIKEKLTGIVELSYRIRFHVTLHNVSLCLGTSERRGEGGSEDRKSREQGDCIDREELFRFRCDLQT